MKPPPLTAGEWLTRYIELTGSVRSGRNWQCPSHRDSSPSLSLQEGRDGRALIHCHGGCSAQEVMAALGLSMGTLFEPLAWPPEKVFAVQLSKPTYAPPDLASSSRGAPRGQPISVEHHVYVPGRVRLRRARYAGGRKRVTWEHSRDGKEWWNGLGDWSLGRLPLYFESELLLPIGAQEPIMLCESESSVDALRALGAYSTTWAGGASSPPLDRLRDSLAGGNVVWIPDADEAGRRCSARIREALVGVCCLSVFEPAQGDARDALVALSPRDMITMALPL